MVDLHTHTLLSDGELLASELARRAEVIGYEAIGITDHCDWSNIDFVVPHLVKAADSLNRHFKIKVIPGAEITHAPIEEIEPLVKMARKLGARLVVVHGETLSEPVIKGTNRRAIECRADILAHPGNITQEDAALAAKNKVYLEITARKNHCSANRHVVDMARLTGAGIVLNTDAHSPGDLITDQVARTILKEAALSDEEVDRIFNNSRQLLKKLDKS